jgi:hypothetical protein
MQLVIKLASVFLVLVMIRTSRKALVIAITIELVRHQLIIVIVITNPVIATFCLYQFQRTTFTRATETTRWIAN